MSEFGNDIVTLLDEDGNEVTFEHLDTMEQNGNIYVALVPVHDDPMELLDATGELVVLKSITDESGEESLISIDDEDEYDDVVMAFESRLEDEYEFEDESEI